MLLPPTAAVMIAWGSILMSLWRRHEAALNLNWNNNLRSAQNVERVRATYIQDERTELNSGFFDPVAGFMPLGTQRVHYFDVRIQRGRNRRGLRTAPTPCMLALHSRRAPRDRLSLPRLYARSTPPRTWRDRHGGQGGHGAGLTLAPTFAGRHA